MEYVLGAGPFAPEKVAEASHLGDKLLEAAETLVHAVTLLWIWRVRLLGDPLQGVFKAEVANWIPVELRDYVQDSARNGVAARRHHPYG